MDFLIHSVAFAPPQDLRKPYVQTSRAGWHLAMDISVYSLVAACRAAAPLMTGGGAIVTISYFGGEKVMPGYNLMGVCKAALEHSVRYLAWDLGRQNIRVNAISAGPMRTLSAAGIADFDDMRAARRREGPLGPQRRSAGTGRRRPLSARRPFRAASPARRSTSIAATTSWGCSGYREAADGRIHGNTQCCSAMALRFDLLPDELRPKWSTAASRSKTPRA